DRFAVQRSIAAFTSRIDAKPFFRSEEGSDGRQFVAGLCSKRHEDTSALRETRWSGQLSPSESRHHYGRDASSSRHRSGLSVNLSMDAVGRMVASRTMLEESPGSKGHTAR